MRGLIYVLLILEFVWAGLRPISYILVDLFPLRIFGLPLITVSFIQSILLTSLVLLTSTREQRNNVSVDIILLLLIVLVATLSAFFNPVRDVLNESKGFIIFISSIITFRLVKIRGIITEQTGVRLLHLSLTTLYSWLMFRLLNDPFSLPMGYSDGYGLRFEGLYSSAPLPLLVVSSLYLFMHSDWASGFYKFFALYSIFIVILALVLAGTRSTMVVSILTAVLYLKLKRSIFALTLVVVLIMFSLGDLTYFIALLERFNEIKGSSVGSDRIYEMQKEIEIFLEFPLGRGFGILNLYTIPNFGKPLFGHNIFTFLLVRHGLFGVLLFLSYLRFMFLLIARSNYHRNGAYVILFGVLMLCAVSNFSTYLLFGTYGIYFGLVLGEKHGNITSNRTF